MSDGNGFSGAGDEFGGENQDVCSFFANIVGQRRSIERLLNWLRESQTTCTDTNCFDELNGLGHPESHEAFEGPSQFDDPFSLVLCILFGFLTIYAMNLARDRQSRSVKNNKRPMLPGENDDHPSNYRRDNDDDSRPAL